MANRSLEQSVLDFIEESRGKTAEIKSLRELNKELSGKLLKLESLCREVEEKFDKLQQEVLSIGHNLGMAEGEKRTHQAVSMIKSKIRKSDEKEKEAREMGYSSLDTLIGAMKRIKEDRGCSKTLSYYKERLPDQLLQAPLSLKLLHNSDNTYNRKVNRFLLENLYPTFETFLQSYPESLEELTRLWNQSDSIEYLVNLHNKLIRVLSGSTEGMLKYLLPKEFDTPPKGWIKGKNNLTVSQALRKLKNMRSLLEDTWREIEATEEDPKEVKERFLSEYRDSTSPEDLEISCYFYLKNLDWEEEDPRNKRVEVYPEAVHYLEDCDEYPVQVVQQLLDYCYTHRVHCSELNSDWTKGSLNPAKNWFEYVITCYLNKTDKAEREEIDSQVSSLMQMAEYAEMLREDGKEVSCKAWKEGLSMEDIEAGIMALSQLNSEGNTKTYQECSHLVKSSIPCYIREEKLRQMQEEIINGR